MILVDEQIVNQLVALNRAFYTRFARAFAETRSSAQASLARIVAYIPNGARVLDIGCGDGRLARRLDQAGLRVTYLGLDFSMECIALATARNAHLRGVAAEFHAVDITQPGWHEQIHAPGLSAQGEPPAAPFDVAFALAVLHHVPGFGLRRDVLRGVRALLRPGGRLVLTNWQFVRSERLRKKIVAWRTVGLDERELEPGDALLDWKRGGLGYRYCHLVTEDEVVRLAAQSDFRVVEQFYTDADLNLCSVLAN